MSSTGLSRRRVGGGGGDNDGEGSNRNSAAPSTTTTTTTPATSNGHGHAGTALAGGNKIAYDPDEDKDTRLASGSTLPKLNLTEEVVLVGLKDKAGYLSFWNDSISYALRGCILLELALRKRIAVVNTPGRRGRVLSERVIEVVDDRGTGETLLDEAMKLIRDKMKGEQGERLGVGAWVDLMSGETWNVLKISYQLKQVRERIQKGLVDKGLLSTSKTNFLLFDMATHPCTPLGISQKASIVNRINTLLFSKSTAIPEGALVEEGTQYRVLRSVALVAASYASSVVENAMSAGKGAVLGFEEKEEALTRCDDILNIFSTWPFASSTTTPNNSSSSSSRRRQHQQGTTGEPGQESISELANRATKELQLEGGENWELYAEVVAAVFEIWSRMDSIL